MHAHGCAMVASSLKITVYNPLLQNMATCPPEEALSSSKARRLRRFVRAFKAGAECVRKGPPGLSITTEFGCFTKGERNKDCGNGTAGIGDSASVVSEGLSVFDAPLAGDALAHFQEHARRPAELLIPGGENIYDAESSSLSSRSSVLSCERGTVPQGERLLGLIPSGRRPSTFIDCSGVSGADPNEVGNVGGYGCPTHEREAASPSMSSSFSDPDSEKGDVPQGERLLESHLGVTCDICCGTAPVLCVAGVPPRPARHFMQCSFCSRRGASCAQPSSHAGEHCPEQSQAQGSDTGGVNPLDAVYEIVAELCCQGLPIGDDIVLTGLVAELNGRRGRVVSISDDKEKADIVLEAADPDGRAPCISAETTNLLICKDSWADISDVIAYAAPLNITEEEVIIAINNWEALCVQEWNACRSKVRFAVPFIYSIVNRL